MHPKQTDLEFVLSSYKKTLESIHAQIIGLESIFNNLKNRSCTFVYVLFSESYEVSNGISQLVNHSLVLEKDHINIYRLNYNAYENLDDLKSTMLLIDASSQFLVKIAKELIFMKLKIEEYLVSEAEEKKHVVEYSPNYAIYSK